MSSRFHFVKCFSALWVIYIDHGHCEISFALPVDYEFHREPFVYLSEAYELSSEEHPVHLGHISFEIVLGHYANIFFYVRPGAHFNYIYTSSYQQPRYDTQESHHVERYQIKNVVGNQTITWILSDFLLFLANLNLLDNADE